MTINKAELERRRRELLFNYQTRQACADTMKLGGVDKRADLFNRVSSIRNRSIQDMASGDSKKARESINALIAKPKDLLQQGKVNAGQKSASLSHKPFISPDRYV